MVMVAMVVPLVAVARVLIVDAVVVPLVAVARVLVVSAVVVPSWPWPACSSWAVVVPLVAVPRVLIVGPVVVPLVAVPRVLVVGAVVVSGVRVAFTHAAALVAWLSSIVSFTPPSVSFSALYSTAQARCHPWGLRIRAASAPPSPLAPRLHR